MSVSLSPLVTEPGPVLVVDDEDGVRNLLCRLVERAGGRPTPAKNATEARELFGRHHYLCAILDKNLPDGTGVDLLREFRAEAPAPEVLMVTGYANLDSAVEALRLGAFDYLVKPFEIEEAVSRIRRALERRTLYDERDVAISALRSALRKLELQSAEDPSSGLAGRAVMSAEVARELARVRQFGRPLWLLRIHFGQGVPEAAQLFSISAKLRSLASEVDLFGRLDDDTLVMLCPEADGGRLDLLRGKVGSVLAEAGAGGASVEVKRIEPGAVPSPEELFTPARRG